MSTELLTLDLEKYSDGTLYPKNGLYEGLIEIINKVAQKEKGVFLGRNPIKDGEEKKNFSLLNLTELKINGKTLKEHISDLLQGNYPLEDVFRYMMLSAACYVEVPRNKFIGGESVQSYDKWLCTSSVPVVANWMGLSLDETRELLKGKLDSCATAEHLENNTTPWVKLETDKDGKKKIVKSRNLLRLDQTGLRVTPLVFLETYLNVILEKAEEGYVEVTYLKDSGQFRTLVTTLNWDLLSSVYSGSYARDVIMQSENKDEPNWKTRARGYIRVPEVGLPENETGVRALNFNRIVKIRSNVLPDLRYVKVDLNNVVTDVNNIIETFSPELGEEVVQSLIQNGVLDEHSWKNGETWKKDPTIYNLMTTLSSLEVIVGTDFKKSLYDWTQGLEGKLFLPNYTGQINSNASSETVESAFREGILVENSDKGENATETLPDTSQVELDFDIEW